MPYVYLGLGSNMGDRLSYLRDAVSALSDILTHIRCSSVYETAPVGHVYQPTFLNAVIGGECELAPLELLLAVKAVERRLGRIERFRWGPREIDIDILLYGDIHMDHEALCIPHQSLHERAFVLLPLVEMAPQVMHPSKGLSMSELLHALPSEALSSCSCYRAPSGQEVSL